MEDAEKKLLAELCEHITFLIMLVNQRIDLIAQRSKTGNLLDEPELVNPEALEILENLEEQEEALDIIFQRKINEQIRQLSRIQLILQGTSPENAAIIIDQEKRDEEQLRQVATTSTFPEVMAWLREKKIIQ